MDLKPFALREEYPAKPIQAARRALRPSDLDRIDKGKNDAVDARTGTVRSAKEASPPAPSVPVAAALISGSA